MCERLHDRCMWQRRQEPLPQWTRGADMRLAPAAVSRGSERKVCRQCEKGHRRQTAVHTRTGLKKCARRICAGRVGAKERKQYRTMQARYRTFAVQPAGQGDG